MEDKALQFIRNFIKWYQDSYGQPDVVNHIKLVELVKEAEDIYTQKINELTGHFDRAVEDYGRNVKPNTKVKQKTSKKQIKKRISRYL